MIRVRDTDKVVAVPRRILVVDDNQDAAESLAMLLDLDGHEVRMVHYGLDAVDVATTFEPDVISLDIGLPKLNGCDAARRMRGGRTPTEAVLQRLGSMFT